MIDLRGAGARKPVVAMVAAMAAAGAALVAGCGSDSGSAASTPSTPRAQLLLTQEQLPAGSTVMELPEDRLRAALADNTELQQGGTFTPADCAATQRELAEATKQLQDQAAIVAANNSTSGAVIVEFITDRTRDLAEISGWNSKCPKVTLVSDIEGRQISTESTVENLSAPGTLSGVDAVAYRTTSVSSVGGATGLTTTSYTGYAVVRGLVVGVQVSALADTLDDAVFTTVFSDAVQKVRDAS